ncbi:MAG: AI-2E family transporter [Gammaproteobacteria bacterium]
MAEEDLPIALDPVRLATWCVIVAALLATLIIGKALLIPLAIAILLWVLLDAIRGAMIRWAPGNRSMPRGLATLLAILLTLAGNYVVVWIILAQAEAFTAALPAYQANLETLMGRGAALLGLDDLPTTASVLNQIDYQPLLAVVSDSIGSLISSIALILIFLGFLLAEESILPEKLTRLQSDPEKSARLQRVILDISTTVQRYVGMKTGVSLLTGIVSYAVLAWVGVDFAALWGLLIFLLNFIPNIGSVLGVVFPALLALVQFDTLTPFLIIVGGLGAVQFIIGNILEPAFMGRTLNMSSLMILMSLTFWGLIWGLPGMFLSVPMMVVTGIVCANIKGLSWFSVVLSGDGRLVTDHRQ